MPSTSKHDHPARTTVARTGVLYRGCSSLQPRRGQAVRAHREEQPRADEQVAVERAEHRGHHDRRREHRADRAEQSEAEFGGDGGVLQLLHLVAGDDQVVGDVRPAVEHDEDQRRRRAARAGCSAAGSSPPRRSGAMFIQPWYAQRTPTSAAPNSAQFTPSQLAGPRRARSARPSAGTAASRPLRSTANGSTMMNRSDATFTR